MSQAAAVPMRPLAWELPYTAGVTVKRKNNKKTRWDSPHLRKLVLVERKPYPEHTSTRCAELSGQLVARRAVYSCFSHCLFLWPPTWPPGTERGSGVDLEEV